MTDPRPTALEELETTLQALLSQLDSDATGASREPWENCQAAFERLRAELGEPLPESAREGVERVLRLVSVAAVSAGRQHEETAGELAALSEARGRLRRVAKSRARTAQTGRDCDVAG